jgi:dTDP-4-dehydrorhamnose 3,5-epimerase
MEVLGLRVRFTPAPLDGAWLVEIEPIEDERGFFARSFCAAELEARGLCSQVAQCSVSFNRRRGTLRGMHLQRPPHAEVKLVRCTRGAIFDVILDLRPDSPTRLAWAGYELTAENRSALYIPQGVAHGMLTLADDCEVYYQMSEFYHGPSARGVRYDDPAFGIQWPQGVRVISERDAGYPLWEG